jgi:hypothetical protein
VVAGLEIVRPTLEDTYLELVGDVAGQREKADVRDDRDGDAARPTTQGKNQ